MIIRFGSARYSVARHLALAPGEGLHRRRPPRRPARPSLPDLSAELLASKPDLAAPLRVLYAFTYGRRATRLANNSGCSPIDIILRIAAAFLQSSSRPRLDRSRNLLDSLCHAHRCTSGCKDYEVAHAAVSAFTELTHPRSPS
jgi:hypothetical protein